MHPNDRIGRELKLQNLHVFMTVVETGSMSGAAKRLNTVQPAVSRSVAELERAFGVRLLDRHRQGVTPTEYGRALLDCSMAAFDDLRRGVRDIESLADPDAGEVRIGCSPLLAATYVPTVVDRISRRKPRIVIELITGYNEALQGELRERKIDLWIARAFGRVRDARLNHEHLFDDHYAVVVGSRSPWIRRRKVALADLVDEAWTLPPLDSMIGSHLAEVFRASGLERPRTTLVTLAPETRFGLVATGRFITMMPVSALRFPVQRHELRALPIELPLAAVPVNIVTLKHRLLNPTAHLFIEHAREVAKPLVGAIR
ncbi:LysR family transcriptional regulator [Bradyrhizobium commune]|uniref:LysR family transcriptional regulator n=1 Tax=Bradyrhizobium commune TaxID=83627 RepID=A0A7S9D3I5_9BRAD|nr:LysR family transcriptional regulator [Bradyrhizobium commune]QPF90486.1 LysR family transcriptional regulator [Bradyrhizobium commune]